MNRLRLHQEHPEFDDAKLPPLDLDTSKLDQKRETTVSRDRFGDLHIKQKRDGVTHIVSLDEREVYLVLTALKSLIKERER